MALAELRYRFNVDTSRWEVVQRSPGGVDAVIQDYATSGEAVEHVGRAKDDLLGKPEMPS